MRWRRKSYSCGKKYAQAFYTGLAAATSIAIDASSTIHAVSRGGLLLF